MPTILRVGLTGGIGAGKSTVAGLLDGPGFLVIDADRLGHAILEEDETARSEIVAALGEHVLDAAGRIDRASLGATVFADASARADLEAILHPRIRAAEVARIERWGVPQGIAVTEAALLVETGGSERYDRLVVTTASVPVRLARLAQRGLPEQEARRRIEAQLPDSDKVAVAHYVIDNDGAAESTAAQVAELREHLLEDLETLRAGLNLPTR